MRLAQLTSAPALPHPGQAPAQVGRMYEQRYNVALSRARDRMVLFRSLNAGEVRNSDDLKMQTIQFFSRAADSGGRAPHASRAGAGTPPRLADESTVEGQLQGRAKAEGASRRPRDFR